MSEERTPRNKSEASKISTFRGENIPKHDDSDRRIVKEKPKVRGVLFAFFTYHTYNYAVEPRYTLVLSCFGQRNFWCYTEVGRISLLKFPSRKSGQAKSLLYTETDVISRVNISRFNFTYCLLYIILYCLYHILTHVRSEVPWNVCAKASLDQLHRFGMNVMSEGRTLLAFNSHAIAKRLTESKAFQFSIEFGVVDDSAASCDLLNSRSSDQQKLHWKPWRRRSMPGWIRLRGTVFSTIGKEHSRTLIVVIRSMLIVETDCVSSEWRLFSIETPLKRSSSRNAADAGVRVQEASDGRSHVTDLQHLRGNAVNQGCGIGKN